MRKALLRIAIVVGGVVILAGGFLMWYGLRHPGGSEAWRREREGLRPGEEYGVQYREPGEIVIEDIGGGKKRVTDTRQGYSVEVPVDWSTDEPETKDDSLTFWTPECRFELGFITDGRSPEDIIAANEENNLPFLTVEEYEIDDTQVAGLPAKHVVISSVERGYSEKVYVATGRATFGLSFFALMEDRSSCKDAFLQLLDHIRFDV